MARLTREVLVTEKIDGTNGQIYIAETGEVCAGSRNRWITPGDDNYGFARWVEQNKEELRKLGPGRHFGEWWGLGIQRGYNLSERRFSLFNAMRWHRAGEDANLYPVGPHGEVKETEPAPECCHVVPVLYFGTFSTQDIDLALMSLYRRGSSAAPGFTDPEGIIAFHVAGNVGFKKTLNNDGPKGAHIEN